MSKNKQARVLFYKPQHCISDAYILIAGRVNSYLGNGHTLTTFHTSVQECIIMRRDKCRNNDPCNLPQVAISQVNLDQNMSALIRKRRLPVIASSTICLHLVLGVTFLLLFSSPSASSSTSLSYPFLLQKVP